MNNGLTRKLDNENPKIRGRTASSILPDTDKHLPPNGSLANNRFHRCYSHWPLHRLSNMEKQTSWSMVGKEDEL